MMKKNKINFVGVYSHSLLFCDIPSWRLATGLKILKKINGFKRSKDPHPQLVFLWILWAGTEQRARKKKRGGGEEEEEQAAE